MAVPIWFALLLGAAIGALMVGPVQRWIVALRRAIRIQRQRTGGRKSSLALLFIFATMHPAPWLLALGLPYGVYRVLTDPLRATWLLVLSGALLAAVVIGLAQRRLAGRWLQAAPESAPRD